MTDEQMDKLAKQLPFVKAWVAAVEAELLARLENGVKFDAVELVPKRATRKWTDSADMTEVLKALGPIDRIAPRVVLSPSKAEEEFGKAKMKAFAEYVVKESSGVTIAYK